MTTLEVRPMVAGQVGFYPSQPEPLRAMLRRMLKDAGRPGAPGLRPGILVCPHAGYAYSGPTAARAYGLLAGWRYERVIVIGPSHYCHLHGATVCTSLRYETPLGEIPVDQQFVGALLHGSGNIASVAESEMREHSVEVQMPFLQETLGEFEAVPMQIGNPPLSTCESIARTLVEAMKMMPRETLVVASSDLYHGPGSEAALAVSRRTAEVLETGDPDKFHEAVRGGTAQACGASAITVALCMGRILGYAVPRILALTTSFEVSPRSAEYVVGYLSAVMDQPAPVPSGPEVFRNK